jgi:hypothetical protein
MSSCVPSSALDKQHFKIDLTGTSFQAFDIHSTIIDADTLFILPLGVLIQPGITVFTGKMFECMLIHTSSACNQLVMPLGTN